MSESEPISDSSVSTESIATFKGPAGAANNAYEWAKDALEGASRLTRANGLEQLSLKSRYPVCL